MIGCWGGSALGITQNMAAPVAPDELKGQFVAVAFSNSPRFEANPNTGRPFRADKETRVAKNTLHLSAKYPSRIVLPVAKATNDR
jgi:hypothetical protein